MPDRRRIPLRSLALAALCFVPTVAGPAGDSRLAVVIVVDGLPYDRLEALRPWFTSGWKRLLDEGAAANACRYAHLNTETGPGHASIATGTPPRVHGIPLNEWFVPSPDRTRMLTVYSASQPASGEAEDAPDTILGPGRLRVPTLGDRLVAKDPRSRVVSISGKDRAAILMAGRDRRHAVAWWSTKDAAFQTSPAYDAASPAGAALARIVSAFDSERDKDLLAAKYGATWSRLPLPPTPPKDGFAPGLEEHRDHKLGPIFPHAIAAAKMPYASALMWSPIGDQLVTDLALRILDDDDLALGRRGAPDLLMISFSANDYVSHFDGPDSIEELEVLRALDVDLGRILDELSAKFPEGARVVLSSDHGFLPLPEAVQAERGPGAARRIPLDGLVTKLNDELEDTFCLAPDADPVFRLESWSLFLDRTSRVFRTRPGKCGRAGREVTRDQILAALPRAARRAAGSGVARVQPIAAACPSGDNACVLGRAGDAFLLPREGTLLDWNGGRGTSHGSGFDYDTHVPLIFWGTGVARGRIELPVTPYDIAPTLAEWLGVSLPDATGTAVRLRGPGGPISR